MHERGGWRIGENRGMGGIFCEGMGVKCQAGQDLSHRELCMEVRSIFNKEIKMSGLVWWYSRVMSMCLV